MFFRKMTDIRCQRTKFFYTEKDYKKHMDRQQMKWKY